MAGRGEGTGALIEPRNHHEQASWPCRHDHPSITVVRPMVGETDQASHTEIRTLPVFMTKPSPQDRRGEPPAIQIRPSNELPETFMRQKLPWKLGSANRTVVSVHIDQSEAFLRCLKLATS